MADGEAATPFLVRRIGTVRSSLRTRDAAPRQADEGAPSARIEVDVDLRAALDGIRVGDRVVVVTWLHLADREVLRTRPRSDPSRDVVGVFATRSPDRPNPLGLHRCQVVAVDETGLEVDALEAVDGTPVVDLKPALTGLDER